MKKSLLPTFIMLALFQLSTFAQTYHEDDKEGLRQLLRQKTVTEFSPVPLFEVFGLTKSDTLNWNTSETWIPKLAKYVKWDSSSPAKVYGLYYDIEIANTYYFSIKNIDCSKFLNLTELKIDAISADKINITGCKNIKDISVRPIDKNTIDFSLIPSLESARIAASGNIIQIDLSKNIKLKTLHLSGIGNIVLPEKDAALELFKIDNVYLNTFMLKDLPNLKKIEIQENSRFVNLRLINLEGLTDFSYIGEDISYMEPQHYCENLEIDSCPQIKSLIFSDNRLYKFCINNTLKVSNCENLATISSSRNYLRNVDATNCPLLSELSLEDNILSNIKTKNCPQLKTLFINTLRTDSLSIDMPDLTKVEFKYNNSMSNLKLRIGKTDNPLLILIPKLNLVKLDLTECINLESLDCSNNYELGNIDLSKNTKIKKLISYNTSLTSLDLSKNTNLSYLDISQNQITDLELAKSTNLVYVDVSDNKITSIDLSKNSKLETVNVSKNNFLYSTLLLPNNNNLKKNIEDITTYVVRPITIDQLIDLSSEHNIHGNITTYSWMTSYSEKADVKHEGNGIFSISKKYAGTRLICTMKNAFFPDWVQEFAYDVAVDNEDQLEAIRSFLRQPSNVKGKNNIDLVKASPLDTTQWYENTNWIDALTYASYDESPISLRIRYSYTDQYEVNNITSISLLNSNTYDTTTYIGGNLDLSLFSNLTEIHIANSTMEKIDLSQNTELLAIKISNNNKLTSLDLSKMTQLQELYCINNKLSSLTLPKTESLTKIDLSNNQLTELSIAGFTKLRELYCANNKLTILDVSKLTGLSDLYCNNNALTSLDISNFQKFYTVRINCSNNFIKELIFDPNQENMYLSIANNNMTFSTLPIWDKSIYCSPQRDVNEGKVAPNTEVDLGSEALIGGNSSFFQWVDKDGKDITPKITNKGKGKFVIGTEYLDQTLTCKIQNETFPDLEMNHKFKVVKDVTGIEDEKANGAGIKVYPNPVKDVLNIESDDMVKSATLFDISGRVVKTESGNVEQINVSDLPKGFYYLKATTQSGKQSTLKIKKH